MKHRRQVVSPISLRNEYIYPGDYSVKMIIDPRESPEIETVTVNVHNSDGKPMSYGYRRWGTKLTVNFTVDDRTPDGVSFIDITLFRKDGTSSRERFDFWTIK